MIKVFLVEDEIVVRNGIKKQINWEKEGFEFVGEASDGELAFPMIQQLKPEIIITDIKMPFMDGLQLSKLVKKEMPWVKIIILSGYDEFDYAKEAINIGITDYLLKPIASAELLSAVVRVSNIIYEEQLEKENLELYKVELKENEIVKQHKFFIDLVSKKIPLEELFERSKEFNIDMVARCYNIILFKMFDKKKDSNLYWDESVDIKLEFLNKNEKNTNVVVFDRENEGTAFLVKGQNYEALKVDVEKTIQFIQEYIAELEDKDYFMGVGIEVSRLSELNVCFDNASKAFAYRYIIGMNQVVYCENLDDYHVVPNMGLDIQGLDINKIDKTIVDSFLRTGSKSEAKHFLTDYFYNFGEKNTDSFLFCQYITLNAYFCCISLMEEMGHGFSVVTDKCGELQDIITRHPGIDAIIKYMVGVFEEVLEYRDKNSVNKYSNLLSVAKEYINENYASEDISLNSVAHKVNVSTSHFSTIFSQETGQNFIEYLTEVRMQKAKELLRCSSMKSSEVGYSVGYKDPHYFSFLFKKTQGFTPKEYRSKGKGEAC